MITIVPCERSHLESMKGRTIDEVPANPQDLSASVSIIKSIIKDDGVTDAVVIGSGGFMYVEEDHYYVWSVLTRECVENHKVTLHKIGKKFMEEIAPKLGIRQITAFVIAGFTTGVEWAEVFGFEYEAYVADPNALQDYVKMRWLWEH